MSYSSNITVHQIGPCEWLGATTFTLLCANSSSSARAVHLHGGPLRAFRFSNYPTATACKSCGPTQQSRVLLYRVPDGLTQAICHILQSMKWAHASGLELLHSPCSRPIRAHRQGQSICVVGHYEHFVREPSHCLQIVWAHTTVLCNSPLCA